MCTGSSLTRGQPTMTSLSCRMKFAPLCQQGVALAKKIRAFLSREPDSHSIYKWGRRERAEKLSLGETGTRMPLPCTMSLRRTHHVILILLVMNIINIDELRLVLDHLPYGQPHSLA